MAVKGHIFKIKLFFVSVFVNEGGFKLSFSAGAEAVNLNLFCKVHIVAAQKLEDGFLCAPVDGQLRIALFI